MISKILNLFLSLGLILTLATPAIADDEVRSLTVDTKVKGFSQTDWHDNQESQTILFGPNSNLQLRLVVKNQGNRNQTNLVVKVTAPSSVRLDTPFQYTIPEIGAGSEYTKDFTITVKDKPFVSQAISPVTIRFDVTSEIGTKAGDFSTFYIGNGTKDTVQPTTTKPILPATGATNLLITTLLSLSTAVGALKLRRFARGY
ncbi:MAG: CARDB domain-containing protein [Candidatus Shapirobacteria bacterium]|jgi:hypothetical protein